MEPKSLVHRLLIVLIPAILAATTLGGGHLAPPGLGGSAAVLSADSDTLPECPRHWERLPKALGGRLSSADGFPVVGTITDVPEFHDCQRLIMPDSTYGPLVAVFAAYNLDTLQTLVSADSAVAGALILNLSLHKNYDALYIRTGYNCLYLWTAPSNVSPGEVDWHARILSVDTTASRCLNKIDPHTAGGNDLVVRPLPINYKLDTAAIPPVARWDWDEVARQHYIGIRCGKIWCEVGAPGFTPSAHYQLPNGPTSKEEWRVRSIKGWYDQQPLADIGAKRPIPSVVGTVFPGPSLDGLLKTGSTGHWFTAAYVNLSRPSPYYKNMLNLDAVSDALPLKRMNTLLFCHGRRDQCIPNTATAASFLRPCGLPLTSGQEIIWFQIKPAVEGEPKYGCVKRHDHSMEVTKRIPNTARWRWLLDDETIWKECIQGCCEVEAGHS